MSTRSIERAVEGCRPIDATPVTLRAAALRSTAPDYLRELKRRLDEEGYVPAEIAVEACFDEGCPFAAQEEVDRIREHVRAADFLGADTVAVEVDAVADESAVRPALEACAERARREGLALDVTGPIDV